MGKSRPKASEAAWLVRAVAGLPRWCRALAGTALVIAFLATIPQAASAAPATVSQPSPGTIFVANSSLPSITEYPPGSSFNSAPTVTISGASTGLSTPMTLALNPAGDLFVDDQAAQAIFEYAPGASGNVAPVDTIQGSETGLDQPTGVALDAAGDIFVANTIGGAGSITEYAPGSNGNVSPTITIPSTNFGNNPPTDLTFNAAGDLFVSDSGNAAVYTFAPPFSKTSVPVATLTGASTDLVDPGGLSFDPSGDLFVANSGSITEYKASNGFNGDVAPVVNFTTSAPMGIGFDSAGDLFVPANSPPGGYVEEFTPPLTTSSTPVNTIEGEGTNLDNPTGVAIALVPQPAKLAFVTQPSGGTAAKALGTQPAVAVEDANGNVVTANTSQVTLSITPGTGASGATLTCTANPVAAAAGVATFAGCAIGKAGTGYKLHATDGSLTAADSSAFAISPGPAAKLAFVTQPSSSFAGQEFTKQPAVAVEDAEGDVVTTNTSDVTLSIAAHTGTSGAALTCAANPVGASAGVATFAGCSISEAGGGYQLHATDGGLAAADSGTFAVTPSPAIDHFRWSTAPIAAPGDLKTSQKVTLTVTALNAVGEPVRDAKVYVSLTKPAPSTEPPADPDTASAVCGPDDTMLPAYCQANILGQVPVTYTASAHQYEKGSDVLTAAVDAFGTDAASDQYTYTAPAGTEVTSYSWSPDPIASAGTLPKGAAPKVTLAALDADGNPVASAPVNVAFAAVPGDNATLTPPTGACTGAKPKPFSCHTDKNGTLVFVYASSTKVPPGGSDSLTASYPTTAKPPATVPARVSDTYNYDKLGRYEWSVDPIAVPGSLARDKQVTLSVTALNAAGHAASNALVYLSLTKAATAVGALPDTASAVCGPGDTRLPAYCPADIEGQVRVVYTTSSNAVVGGADTLTAAADPQGNGAATDQYVYPAKAGTAVASYSWSPDPIAPAGTQDGGKTVPVTVTALDAKGIPIPGAPVQVTLTKAPGSDAKLTPPATGCSATLDCVTGKDGSLALKFVSSTAAPQGGSDGLTASQPKTVKTPAPPPATDIYTYSNAVSHFTWTTDPIAAPGSLKHGQQVTLTVTALDGAGHPVRQALVYVSLARPGGEPVGDADNSSATCGPDNTKLPAYCQADFEGQVQVTYTASMQPSELGSDVLTAAVDPYRTDAATDRYTYLAPAGTAVASYRWTPDPLAAAEGLPAGGTVAATLTALDAEGNPIPSASVTFVFHKAPGSNATLKMPAQGCTGLTCQTGKTGTITVTYASSSGAPTGGSDGIVASRANKTLPALDYYSYE